MSTVTVQNGSVTAGGIAIQWRSSIVEGNSDILYKCCMASAKRNSSLPSTIIGYKSYTYIYDSRPVFHL
jgi:hypothetical protein